MKSKRLSAQFIFAIVLVTLYKTTFALAAEAVDLAYAVRSTMGELNSQKDVSPFTIGLKSQNAFGAISQMGNYLRSRDEIYFGVRSKTGWGFLVSEGYSYTNHHRTHDVSNDPLMADNRQTNRRARGNSKSPNGPVKANSENPNQSVDESVSLIDPTNQTANGLQDISVQFFHPIIKDDDQNLSGMLKSSIPTTEKSQSNNNITLGYNLIYNVKLAKQWNFSSVISFNYFSRGSYTPPLDSIYGAGLINSVNHRLKPWVRLGAGQRTGLIAHTSSPTGTTAELFTTADFVITPSIFMGPRIHFPLYSQGATFSDVPTAATADNISADFFMQVSL